MVVVVVLVVGVVVLTTVVELARVRDREELRGYDTTRRLT